MKIKPHRPMNQCEHCHWSYPSGLLNMMRTNAQNWDGKYVCGICYLIASNEITGHNRETLTGEVAEQFRQAAIEWRRKHPYDDPAKRKKHEATGN